MATKVNIANLKDEMATKAYLAAVRNELKNAMAAMKSEMATKTDLATLRSKIATKNDLNRLETTMHGEFEQVHIRFNSLDRRVDTRMGQIETYVSRLQRCLSPC
jgi:hypothetical protein